MIIFKIFNLILVEWKKLLLHRYGSTPNLRDFLVFLFRFLFLSVSAAFSLQLILSASFFLWARSWTYPSLSMVLRPWQFIFMNAFINASPQITKIPPLFGFPLSLYWNLHYAFNLTYILISSNIATHFINRLNYQIQLSSSSIKLFICFIYIFNPKLKTCLQVFSIKFKCHLLKSIYLSFILN